MNNKNIAPNKNGTIMYTSCDLNITKTRNDEFLHYPTLAQQFIGFTHSMRSMMN